MDKPGSNTNAKHKAHLENKVAWHHHHPYHHRIITSEKNYGMEGSTQYSTSCRSTHAAIFCFHIRPSAEIDRRQNQKKKKEIVCIQKRERDDFDGDNVDDDMPVRFLHFRKKVQ